MTTNRRCRAANASTRDHGSRVSAFRQHMLVIVVKVFPLLQKSSHRCQAVKRAGSGLYNLRVPLSRLVSAPLIAIKLSICAMNPLRISKVH